MPVINLDSLSMLTPVFVDKDAFHDVMCSFSSIRLDYYSIIDRGCLYITDSPPEEDGDFLDKTVLAILKNLKPEKMTIYGRIKSFIRALKSNR